MELADRQKWMVDLGPQVSLRPAKSTSAFQKDTNTQWGEAMGLTDAVSLQIKYKARHERWERR